ncbi:Protein of uncharacterised function DUF262 [uncultured Ruminococcus sp.]|nr:Protein of uncharacterised function DUF262 [uncultured Ruminococcus sp.]
MKYLFRRNTKTIEEINRAFTEGKLFADSSYQRRKVWNDQDKVRLIETILMELVMPEVFFWTTDRDPDTGIASTHIVDGQQRINAIVDFISGEFSLNERYLMNDEIKESCGGDSFSKLDQNYKNRIWDYPISIVEIDTECTIADIKELFYRLNLTNYNLNQQEKRNSKDSVFGDKCEALSTYDFWKKTKLFSSGDARRMKDVEYCCSIYILANEGIVDQTNGKKINNYYDDYKNDFDSNDELKNKILKAMSVIEDILDKTTISFISKKAQMYTLFCVVFKMFDENKSFDDFFEKIKIFVTAYSTFRNEFTLEYEDDVMGTVYADIKKYKLASSEGINKVANRMIRFEILYKMCVEDGKEVFDAMKKITEDMRNLLDAKREEKDKLEKDDLIDEEE